MSDTGINTNGSGGLVGRPRVAAVGNFVRAIQEDDGGVQEAGQLATRIVENDGDAPRPFVSVV